SKDYPRAIAYQQAAIKLSKRHKDLRAEAASYLMLAHALRDKGDVEPARKEVQKAIAVYTGNGEASQAGEAYLELSNTYANYGREIKEKIKYYQQALQLFLQAGNRRRQADVRKDLGDSRTLLHGFSGQLGGEHTLSSQQGGRASPSTKCLPRSSW
ncbi:MAG: hypothetical protein ICV83_04565, partial [Cytophagales bacterium]|nr:hypothetical protein [Cytophagales bacterium]